MQTDLSLRCSPLSFCLFCLPQLIGLWSPQPQWSGQGACQQIGSKIFQMIPRHRHNIPGTWQILQRKRHSWWRPLDTSVFGDVTERHSNKCGILQEYLVSLKLRHLTHIFLVDTSILINWTSPFPVLGVSGVLFHRTGSRSYWLGLRKSNVIFV